MGSQNAGKETLRSLDCRNILDDHMGAKKYYNSFYR